MSEIAPSHFEKQEVRKLSQLLEDLKNGITGESISIDALLEAMHERGIAMVLLLFAAPMALPLPVPPGINVALATPLIVLTAQQVMGAHTIWMPEKIKRRSFSSAKFRQLIDGIIPWMRRLEVMVKPRMGWVTQGQSSRLFGFLGLLMAITVCIPVPTTNTVPSLGIALMSVGFIMRDGAAVIAGAVIGMGWIALLLTGLLIFGPEAIDILKEMVKSIL